MDKALLNPDYYVNRELSWLLFNVRILDEARDKKNPLMERVKFLSITASNLDEFFMVRVASLHDMINASYEKPDLSGMTVNEQLDAILSETHGFIDRQYLTLNRSIIPLLEEEGVRIVTDFRQLSKKEALYCDDYFRKNVYPVLTPMAVDASRPFPLVLNKSLNIASLLKKKQGVAPLVKTQKAKGTGKNDFATVQVPSVLPRLIELPGEGDFRQSFILLEQLILKNIGELYKNYEVVCSYPYRLIRNADLPIDEDDASDLLQEIKKSLHRRDWGEGIRLDCDASMDERLIMYLKKQFDVTDREVYFVNGPIDLTFLMKLYGTVEGKSLYDKPFESRRPKGIPEGADIFSLIRKGDLFMNHPYDSFEPVVEFIRQSAVDKDVLAIKQTLYRVSGNSPIVAALAKAAENGKQVTVLVELKARFDEENNIQWAQQLEKAGCHVIYGLVGLKTHCKIALVVRNEEEGIKRYVHLGTGNYNDKTARQYTDCGIFTCAETIGEDATAVFNMLSGYSEPEHWNSLILAPIWMRQKFYSLIDREIHHAKAGRKALIIAKMNSLCDRDMIAKLYEASRAGVEIFLIVRGICCLKTGIPGISENIHVISIVGTFLEHARIFYFYNDGEEDVFMGSADWMPRNLDRRVEIIFPVLDENIKGRVKHILEVSLKDNLKAYYLSADGVYRHFDRRGKKAFGSQNEFMKEALSGDEDGALLLKTRTFTPVWAVNDGPQDMN